MWCAGLNANTQQTRVKQEIWHAHTHKQTNPYKQAFKHMIVESSTVYWPTTLNIKKQLCHNANTDDKWLIDDPTKGNVECLEMPAK